MPGGWIEAIPLFERTLADSERVRGDTHPDTLTSRNDLPPPTRRPGGWIRPSPLFGAPSPTASGSGANPPGHPDLPDNLASAYQDAGRRDQAIALYERTLADREQVRGDTHPDTLTARNNLAVRLPGAGRLDQAIPLYERTFADSEQVLGDDPPGHPLSRNNLAYAYRAAGRSHKERTEKAEE